MSAKTLLMSLFAYKASADGELLEALKAPFGGSSADRFGAALRVLAHANIVDQIFAANLQRRGHGFRVSWAQDMPTLHQLADSMMDTDRWYLTYVSEISPEELEEIVEFTFTDGTSGRMSREEMLAHVVTHAGYHRGEAGRLLPGIESTAMRDVFAGYLHRADPRRRL